MILWLDVLGFVGNVAKGTVKTSAVLYLLFNDTSTTEIYTYGHTLSLHDALPISGGKSPLQVFAVKVVAAEGPSCEFRRLVGERFRAGPRLQNPSVAAPHQPRAAPADPVNGRFFPLRQREAGQAPENALPLNLPHLLGRLRLAENRMQPVGEFLDMRVRSEEIVEMRQFFPEQRILRQGAHQDGEEIPSGRLGDAEGEVQARLRSEEHTSELQSLMRIS